VTAQDLADNAFMQNANTRLLALSETLRRVPVNIWRNTLIILALLWLSHSLANLFWVLFPVPDLPRPQTIAQPLSEDVVVSGANVDLKAVQGINLSGAPPSAAGGEAQEEVEAVGEIGTDGPVTSLNIKLQGIIASSIDSKGKAIISDSGGQAMYQVGEKLPQGRNVKLARVLADKVILDNDGNLETLPLYSEDDFKGTRNIRTTSRTSVPQRRTKTPSREGAEERRPDGRPPGVKAKVSKAQLAKAKSINDVVRFSLHRENGEVAGYRIRPGRDRGLFDQLGLKTNDVVTSVNGVVINDRNQLREIYKTMRTATEAQLEVNRDGSIIPITVSLDTGG